MFESDPRENDEKLDENSRFIQFSAKTLIYYLIVLQ